MELYSELNSLNMLCIKYFSLFINKFRTNYLIGTDLDQILLPFLSKQPKLSNLIPGQPGPLSQWQGCCSPHYKERNLILKLQVYG